MLKKMEDNYNVIKVTKDIEYIYTKEDIKNWTHRDHTARVEEICLIYLFNSGFSHSIYKPSFNFHLYLVLAVSKIQKNSSSCKCW